MFKDILLTSLLGKVEESATRQACMLAGQSAGTVTALVAASYFVPATAGWAYYREGTDPGEFPNLEAAGRAVLQGYMRGMQERLDTEHVDRVVKGIDNFWLTPSEICARHAGAADVIVVGVSRTIEPEQEKLVAGALAACGRPVLIVPSTSSARMFNHVMVAWKESPEAARALRDAMPILEQAGIVEVVLAGQAAVDGPGDAGRQLVEHLRLHGIAARLARLPKAGAATGRTLVDHALTSGADLIIAGGYSHARGLENVFGGVTAYLVGSSPLAVMFSH